MLEDKIFLNIQSGKDFDCSVIFVMIFSKNLFFFCLASDHRRWFNLLCESVFFCQNKVSCSLESSRTDIYPFVSSF